MADAVKQFRSFLAYSNIFISCCSLALCAETFYLFRLPSSLNWYLLLMFLCTLFVYNLHYYIKSKKEKAGSRLAWCRRNSALLVSLLVASFFFIAGGVAWHYKSIFLHQGIFNWWNFAWFIIIPILSLGYSYPLSPWSRKSLRQIGWLKMVSLSFIWSFTTVVLPVLMAQDKDIAGTDQLVVLFFHRFFFVAALSVLFNVRDFEEDKIDGIKTIAVLAGPEKTLRYGKWVMTTINLLAGVILLHHFRLQHPFYIAAVFAPVVLLFLFYQYFYSGTDETVFVSRYDGLMILKAMLLIFAVLILEK